MKEPKYFQNSTRAVKLLMVLTCLCSCRIISSKRPDLGSVNLAFSLPVVILDQGVNSYEIRDTISISFFKDYVLYRLPEIRQFETETKIKGSESYFIYKKGYDIGYLFKSFDDSTNGTKLPVDSFLRQRAFKGTSFWVDSSYKICSSIWIDSHELLEKYIITTPKGNFTPDSIYYYFTDRMKRIDYTLSDTLDKSKGMKLNRVRIMFNEKQLDTANVTVTMPKREISFEIFENVSMNKNQVTNFIKKVERKNYQK